MDAPQQHACVREHSVLHVYNVMPKSRCQLQNWQRIDVNKYNKDGDDQWFFLRDKLSRMNFLHNFYILSGQKRTEFRPSSQSSKHAVFSKGTLFTGRVKHTVHNCFICIAIYNSSLQVIAYDNKHEPIINCEKKYWNEFGWDKLLLVFCEFVIM